MGASTLRAETCEGFEPYIRERGRESLDALFGAGPFSHQIVLELDRAAGALDPLTRTIFEAGAVLQSLSLSELDGRYCVKVWIKDVSCDTARRLSDRLATLGPIRYTHVEHHLGRPSQPV